MDIYKQLRARLDDYSTGFPETESGIELSILKQIFTGDEAELFLKLTQMPETPEKIAGRTGDDPGELAERLEAMAKKGQLFRLRKGDEVRYSAIPYVIGIFEFQLNRMDEALAKDMERYYEEAFGKTVQSHGTPIMRSIPINRQVQTKLPVAPYEDVMGIIDQQDFIAIAECICRKTAKLAGKGCHYPMETCFLFGSHGRFYVENNMGREITKDEAKKIAKDNDKAGLVMQPFNSTRVGGMCSCCGCCCGIMRSIKMQPVPADAVLSNYYAELDAGPCTGCGVCVDRCQMDAITMKDGLPAIELKRCIGCGLCVTGCDTGAMKLIKKTDEDIYTPPGSGVETYMRIAKARGKI